MRPVRLPCKCIGALPLSVKTDDYKVRANQTGCLLRGYAKLFHLNLEAYFRIEDQFYWNNCACNEYDALRRRHLLGSIPGFIQGNQELIKLETNLVSMSDNFPQFSSVSHKTLIDNTRSSIKKRYKAAYYNLRDRVVNISSKEAVSKTFVKYEKIPIGKYDDGKPPRLIQFRDFTYLYALKKQVLGHSLAMKSGCSIEWFYQQQANTVFTKLYDNYGIARVLHESWSLFLDPIAVCLDHSKFDGHYHSELLKLEHNYWLRLNPSRELAELLKHQLVNRGRTVHGHVYKVNGTRLSGEFTTSEGNSIMNYAMLSTWLQSSGISKARLHVNGDDSVVIMEYGEYQKLLPYSYFNNFNMETEEDRVVTDFRLISYCQAQPIRVMRGGELVWYMVKEPLRTLARMQYSDDRYLSVYQRYLAGIGLCELASNSGVPITQSLAKVLISQSPRPLGSVDKNPALHSGNLSEEKSILDQTRIDYEIAFGVTPSLQKEIEYGFAGALRSAQDLATNLQKFKTFILH